jgi:hypothetical protein
MGIRGNGQKGRQAEEKGEGMMGRRIRGKVGPNSIRLATFSY